MRADNTFQNSVCGALLNIADCAAVACATEKYMEQDQYKTAQFIRSA